MSSFSGAVRLIESQEHIRNNRHACRPRETQAVGTMGADPDSSRLDKDKVTHSVSPEAVSRRRGSKAIAAQPQPCGKRHRRGECRQLSQTQAQSPRRDSSTSWRTYPRGALGGFLSAAWRGQLAWVPGCTRTLWLIQTVVPPSAKAQVGNEGIGETSPGR